MKKRGRPLKKDKGSTFTGKLIRSQRIKKGLTLLDIEKAVGVSQQYFSNVESGYPLSIKYVEELSAVLGLKKSQIVEAIIMDSHLIREAKSVVKNVKITVGVER